MRANEELHFNFDHTDLLVRVRSLANEFVGKDSAEFFLECPVPPLIAEVLLSENAARGLALSRIVEIKNSGSAGKVAGVIVFELIKTDGKWLLSEVGFALPANAVAKRERFQNDHSDAVSVPASDEGPLPPSFNGNDDVRPLPGATGPENAFIRLIQSKIPWGRARDGVKMRLQTLQNPLGQNQDSPLFIEQHPVGAETTHHETASVALEIDGVIYPPRAWTAGTPRATVPLRPGTGVARYTALSAFGSPKASPLHLAPGKHTIAALWLTDSVVAAREIDEHANRDEIARAVSNTIEIVVLAPDEHKEILSDQP